MLSVSAAFRAAVDSDSRSVKGAVIMHFLGEQSLPFATATATSQQDASTAPDQVCNGRIHATDYSCVGHLPNSLNAPQKGWWGSQVASVDGVFATPEILIVTYNTPLLGGNFWLIGIPGYYPINFLVERKVAGIWETVSDVVDNTKYEWSITTVAKLTEQVRVTITKIAPSSNTARIMQFGLISTVIFEGYDIINIDLLEETSSETFHPAGSVSSNECVIDLSNAGNRFVARNTSSAFYGLLKDEIVFSPYVGVEVDSSQFEYVPLGKFFSGDWSAPSTRTVATLVGYDRIYGLSSKTIPKMSLSLNTTIAGLFAQLFEAMGITDYFIDPSLDLPVPYGYIPMGTFGNALQKLVIAGNCCVFVSRLDSISVKPLIQTGASVATFTHSNLTQIDNPQLNRSVITGIVVNYAMHTVQEATIVAQLTDIIVPIGNTVINDIMFQDGPIAAVNQIVIAGTQDVQIVDFSWSPWALTLTLSSSVLSTVSINIYGSVISNTTSAVTQTMGTGDAQTLTIDSELIQSETEATSYISNIMDIVQDPRAKLLVDVRCNPAVELLDVVNISSIIDAIPPGNFTIISSKIGFDGGLSASLSTRANLI